MRKETLMHTTIQNIVKNRLNKVNLDTNRSLRQLIDYGRTFSTGRFQKYYLDLIQTALKNDNSNYFELIKKLTKETDQARVLDFFINLGYDSWTYNANIIRKKTEELKINIPWMLLLDTDENTTLTNEEYIISQGKELGINSFLINTNSNLSLERAMKLAGEFPRACFVIKAKTSFCEEISSSSPTNCFLLLDSDDNFSLEIFNKLKEKKLLLGTYSQEMDFNNVDKIMKRNSKNGILFTFLINKQPNEKVYQEVLRTRNQLDYPMILVDLFEDFQEVNKIISNNNTILQISNNEVLIGSKNTDFCFHTFSNSNKNTLLEILEKESFSQQ